MSRRRACRFAAEKGAGSRLAWIDAVHARLAPAAFADLHLRFCHSPGIENSDADSKTRENISGN